MRKTLLLTSLLLSFVQLFANKKFFAPPTTPASNITFNIIEGGTLRVNWTNGNGARRLVAMRQGAAVTGTPVNGVDYAANAAFGSGDILNAGEFVIYDNNSTFVDVSNLQPNTTYFVTVFEYNGTGSATEYLLTNPPVSSQATLTAPTINASAVNFTNVSGNSATVNWTNGNGTRRLVLMRAGGIVNTNPVNLTAYSANPNFGTGTPLNVDNYVIFQATGNTVNVTSLQPNTQYHVAVFEANGSGSPVYLTAGAGTGSFTTPARPTLPASAMFFNIIDGESLRANWTSGNGIRRIVVARAGAAVDAIPADGVNYTANADFNLGQEIAPGQHVVYNNTSTFVDLTGLTVGTTYHFRVYEYSGSGATIGYLTSSFASGSQATLSPPTTPASNLNFTNIGPNSVTLNWTNGNGSRRVVFAKAGSPVDFVPVDGTGYGANPSFGTSTQLGTGNYAVFSQTTGTSVVVTNLLPGVTYHFAIYEVNGTSTPAYLQPGVTASQATDTRPSVPASAPFFNIIDGGSLRLNWTNGNGARRIVVARAGAAVDATPADGVNYTANADFNLGQEIAPGQRVVYNNTGTFVDLTGLVPATTYHFRIYEYSGTGASIQYLTSSFASASQATLSPPVTQSTNVTFPAFGSNTMTVSWTNGSGNGRIVLMKAGSPVDAVPVNGTSYSANPAFGSGTQVGTGNFVIFRATNGNSVNVTGLSPGITYHVAVFDYNGNSTPAFLTTLPATGSQATSGAPTVPSSGVFFNIIQGNSLRLNWVSGNGARRIVVARAGAAVDALPVNGVDYAANANFELGEEITPGQRVVYDNTSSFVDISGLQPGTIYHFRIYEYSGTGATTQYLTASFGSGSETTLTTPAVQASNVTFTNITGNAMTINWTVGNGEFRLVVVKQGSAVDAVPQDLTIYNASSIFGGGTQLGTGNYAVYRNSGTTMNLTGLLSGTTYHVAVFEINGSGGPVYNQALTAIGNATTIGAPQVNATTLAASSVLARSLQINWTNGSGQRRLVLMRQGAAVNATPVDNTAYTANSFFGNGSEIGTGNFVVFEGTANNITVTNLLPATEYHFSVFEFNSFGASVLFLTAGAPASSAITATALPVIFTDFSATVANDGIQLKWTTSQEQNSDFFEVQKSSDGIAFTTVGNIQAAGNSDVPKNYRFADNDPFSGTSYYRLRQVDKDARFEYSRTVSIKYEVPLSIRKVVNPFRQNIFIQFGAGAVPAGTSWKLYDMQGRLVMSRRTTGNTINEQASSLQPGVYVLEIILQGKKQNIRLLKAE